MTMEQYVKVHKTLPGGRAEVIHFRESACSGECHKCAGCGAAKETLIVQAENPIGACAGDFVTVSSDTVGVLKAAAVVYLIPMILFFLGYWAGSGAGLGAPAGCAGFVLGLILAVWADRMNAKHKKTVYTITGYAPGSGQAES